MILKLLRTEQSRLWHRSDVNFLSQYRSPSDMHKRYVTMMSILDPKMINFVTSKWHHLLLGIGNKNDRKYSTRIKYPTPERSLWKNGILHFLKKAFSPGCHGYNFESWYLIFFACSFCLQKHPDLILDFYFHWLNREKTCK